MRSQKLGTPSAQEQDLQNISLPSGKRTERFKHLSHKDVARIYQESRSELAAEELVTRLRPRLFNFLLGRCSGDRDMAEDVVQITFERAFRKIDQFDTTRPFRPWLFTIAANTAGTLQRKSSFSREIAASRLGPSNDPISFDKLFIDRSAEPIQALIKQEQKEQIEELLSERLKKDPKLEELLPLYLGSVPYENIVKAIGAPLGTIKSRLYRIRRAHEQILRQLS